MFFILLCQYGIRVLRRNHFKQIPGSVCGKLGPFPVSIEYLGR